MSYAASILRQADRLATGLLKLQDSVRHVGDDEVCALDDRGAARLLRTVDRATPLLRRAARNWGGLGRERRWLQEFRVALNQATKQRDQAHQVFRDDGGDVPRGHTFQYFVAFNPDWRKLAIFAILAAEEIAWEAKELAGADGLVEFAPAEVQSSSLLESVEALRRAVQNADGDMNQFAGILRVDNWDRLDAAKWLDRRGNGAVQRTCERRIRKVISAAHVLLHARDRLARDRPSIDLIIRLTDLARDATALFGLNLPALQQADALSPHMVVERLQLPPKVSMDGWMHRAMSVLESLRAFEVQLKGVNHSPDFTRVIVQGVEHRFKPGSQAAVARVLIEDAKRGVTATSNTEIRDRIDSRADRFALSYVFRGHSSWRQIIRQAGRGFWRFQVPTAKTARRLSAGNTPRAHLGAH